MLRFVVAAFIPSVDLLPPDKIRECVPNKIENAGVLEADGQKGVERRDDDGRQEPELRQRKHRNQKTDADDSNVPQLPQPQGGLRLQIVRV